MGFVPAHGLLVRAREEGFAVGAFNLNNMEFLQAIAEAAEEEDSPVILQVSQGAARYAGLPNIVAMARAATEERRVPAALHLDHGTSFDMVVKCIQAGFSSVMIDGSKLPLDQNAELVSRVVSVARPAGVSVEAELGRILGTEDEITVTDREATFTDPHEAARFVELTGVDSLAVAVGSAHGLYRGEPELDFQRLQEIALRVDIPLVLHGASGIPDEAVKKAVALGISKVNIDTELRIAFVSSLRDFLLEHPREFDPRKVLGPSRDAVKLVVKGKMSLFGCSGKAS